MRFSDPTRAMLREHAVKSLDDRVRLLRKLVWHGEAAFDRHKPPTGGLYDPQMRATGLEITSGCKARSDDCELHAIYWFVHNNIRYTGDITRRDTYQSAWRTMQMAGGDCDDQAVLNAVLAMENGFECKFRITSNTGEAWDHIYTMAGVPKNGPRKWIALDSTLPGGDRFAVEPGRAKFKDFPIGEVR